MISETGKQLRIALKLLVVFTLLTGLVYPLLVTGLAQILFHWQANGSLLQVKQQIVGSRLIGQAFSSQQYFWGRPSATTPLPYQATASAGSNFGPANPVFLALVLARIRDLQKMNPQQAKQAIPVDLVTASASGLDPEISPRAAFYQVARVAKARNQPEEKIQVLLKQFIQARTLGLIGEPRVNVLALNLALDQLATHP